MLVLGDSKGYWVMTVKNVEKCSARTLLMRKFLKRLINDDKRARQLFYLYYDRGEISEEQFYEAISR